jgi:hypothetical protein
MNKFAQYIIAKSLVYITTCIIFAASNIHGAQIGPNPNNDIINTPDTAPYSNEWNNVNYDNNGIINFFGNFTNNSTFNNNGTIDIRYLDLAIINTAVANLNLNQGSSFFQWGVLTNQAGGTIKNYSNVTYDSRGIPITGFANSNIFRNYGDFYNYNYFWNGGRFYNYSGARFVNDGYWRTWINYIYGGNVTNNGTMENRSGFINYGGTFTNNGYLKAWDSSYIENMSIFVNTPTGTIENGAARQILNSAGTFTNAGTITNSGSFTNFATATFTNTGIFINQAGAIFTNKGTTNNDGIFTNAGTLNITNQGRFSNTGTLELMPGSSCNLTGGVIDNNPGGVLILRRDFNFGGSAGGNVNLNAGGSVYNYATLKIIADNTQDNNGSLTNYGTFNNTGKFANVGLLINPSVFNNTGILEILPGSSYNLTGGVINNNPGGVIIVRKDSTFDSMTDTIQLNAGGTLQNFAVLTNPAGHTQLNNGAFVNESGGTLINNGDFSTTTALINQPGGTFVNNGNFTTVAPFNNTGRFLGTGTVIGNVENSGTIAPGNSIGVMTIDGNYINNANSVYEVKINNLAQSDKIVITGAATLKGGNVLVIPSGMFLANRPYTYTILHAAGGVTGHFENVATNSAFFTDMSLLYPPGDVNLTFIRKTFNSVCGTSNQCAIAGGSNDSMWTPRAICGILSTGYRS